jgi:hypothetical protein
MPNSVLTGPGFPDLYQQARCQEKSTPIAKDPTMPSSEARIQANRANSLKSCGPKTAQGREHSSRNRLKHGLTGSGAVVHEQDAAEVESRNQALQAELAPQTAMGAILVRQLALLSVRMERGAKQELAAIAVRDRHAADDFDEERIELAERLMSEIGDDPRGNLRRLKKMPEGVIQLGRAWHDLRADLTREPKPAWTASHLVKAANLVGLREEDARGSRLGVLSRAAWSDFEGLADNEGQGLEDDARKAWARARLVERIDAEIAGLEAHLETLDFEMIEQDRAEAGDRALFDPSREAALARRYESEARRGFFQALKEFRRVEAEAAEREEAAPAPPQVPVQERVPEPLASFREGQPASSSGPIPADFDASATPFWARSREVEVVRGPDGRAVTIGRPAPGPA